MSQIPCALTVLLFAAVPLSAQPATPTEVVNAILRADSAGDPLTIVALTHPVVFEEYRRQQSTTPTLMKQLDSTMLNRCQQAWFKQVEQNTLDAFGVPTTDSLARSIPESLFVREYRHDALIRRTRPDPDTPIRERALGHVLANDTSSYVVIEQHWDPQTIPSFRIQDEPVVVQLIRRRGQWLAFSLTPSFRSVGRAYGMEPCDPRPDSVR